MISKILEILVCSMLLAIPLLLFVGLPVKIYLDYKIELRKVEAMEKCSVTPLATKEY